MSRLRQIAAVSGTLILLPVTACAATAQQYGRPSVQGAYNTGVDRGERAGYEDARRGDRFEFSDESEYRNFNRARPQDTYEARYRDEFLRGFESGYRRGYGVTGERRGQVGAPPWSNGRGYGRGGVVYDLASDYGYQDGYNAGVNDARDRHQFDFVGESRYRSGDRGYERNAGSRDDYRARYRQAFRQGYEQGYYGGYR